MVSDVAIIGYGVYIPMYRIPHKEIAEIWGRGGRGMPPNEKAVAGPDEDTVTISVEAAINALNRAKIDPQDLGAIYVGTESKPYAVKPTSTIVAEAIGATPNPLAADLEFACKAGTEAFIAVLGLVASNNIKAGMAIGADIARGRPSDELEYTTGSGAAAYILAQNNNDAIAKIEGRYTYVTDTPDFWRREGQYFPMHTYRFTGDPAYFTHVENAAKGLMSKLGLKPSDFRFVSFHQPNVKFPLQAAEDLGFTLDQIKPTLLNPVIGNAYAGSSLLGLAAALDISKPGDRLLIVSFGSGAGSDAISIIVEDGIEEKRDLAPKVTDYISRRVQISYGHYVRFREKLKE